MVRSLRSLLLLLLLVAPSAFAGNPWEELMGRKPQMWSDPQGRFVIDLPQGWKDEPKSSVANTVDFWRTDAEHGVTARVSVEVRVVPKGVKLSHFVERVNEDGRKSVREHRILQQDQIQVSGVAARRQLVTYQVLGHTEIVNEAVQVILVGDERAYVITLVSPAGTRGLFWEEFELMTKGFSAGGSESSAVRTSPDQPRKKLRAGEMVNPDALKY
ncbi:MAG: hypothetical protein HY791_33060 [Deltaproteobacteria bacterium]|nr:hypothetical protein [Deltaproteobacteria bacterium]